MGKISKEWSGWGKEIFTDGDNFGVSFPLDLDAKVKATLLGLVFLIVSDLCGVAAPFIVVLDFKVKFGMLIVIDFYVISMFD